MSLVSASVESMASAVSSTNNRITLIDWMSPFLTTLEKFNGVVDQISTVSVTLRPTSLSRMLIQPLDSSLRGSIVDYPLFCYQGLANPFRWSHNLIYGLQIIIEQAHLDISVCELLSKSTRFHNCRTESHQVLEDHCRAHHPSNNRMFALHSSILCEPGIL